MTDGIPEAASAAHLTDVLRGAGVLAGGRVASVAVETSRQMLLSTNLRLRLEFEGQPGAAPWRVLRPGA